MIATLVLFLSACGGLSNSDRVAQENWAFKVFTNEEGKRFDELADNTVKAIVANGYRAIGSRSRRTESGGTIAAVEFAKCRPNQSLQECSDVVPTPEKPRFSNSGWWRTDIATIQPTGSSWHFVSNGFLAACRTSFPMNPYAVTQVSAALQSFVITGGRPHTGERWIDLPPNPDPNGPPGMGKVAWDCDTYVRSGR